MYKGTQWGIVLDVMEPEISKPTKGFFQTIKTIQVNAPSLQIKLFEFGSLISNHTDFKAVYDKFKRRTPK